MKLEGYQFFGFFYDKSGKNPYEGDILTQETTLYAQWWSDSPTDKKDNIENSSNDENNSKENNSNENTGDQVIDNKITNPQTGDNIMIFVGLLVISVVGILVTTKFIKMQKDN